MKTIILLNAAGSLFLLYLILQTIRTALVRKKSKPVHKQPFRIHQMNRSRKHIIVIICSVLLWTLWLYGIFQYEMYQLPLLYFAAITGLTIYYPLFRQGKVGKTGITIADTLIPWQDVENIEFISSKKSDFHYPNQKLTVYTKNGSHYSLIVDNENTDNIKQLLTDMKLNL